MKQIGILGLVIVLFFSCKTTKDFSEKAKDISGKATEDISLEVQSFLDEYTSEFKALAYESALAEWDANTKIIPGDETNAKRVEAANGAYADFTGSTKNIEQTRKFLERRKELPKVQQRQLDAILYAAANNPQTVAELVAQRITAENAQNEALFGYTFKVDGKEVSTGGIDKVLRESDDETERLKNWEASKEVGIVLKDGLENLRDLRNQTVQGLGYDDYFSYQVSDYGMEREELTSLMDKMVKEVWPLYRELHTWARHELAAKYSQEVPEYLPAHWLPNRWGQDWSALVDVEGLDLDSALKDKDPEWIVKQGEDFFVGLGYVSTS